MWVGNIISYRLTVKMTFKDRSRKRINRRVSKLNRKKEQLQSEVQQLRRQLWRLKKRGSRESMSSPTSKSVSTPVKEADRMLQEEGISPRKVPNLRRKLVMHQSVLKHLKGEKKSVQKKVLKSASRTKSSRLLANAININRRASKAKQHTSRSIASYALRQKIKSYYYTPEVSTCLPGKKDTVKVGREQRQKYILNDTIGNVHRRYHFDNAGKPAVSLATFKRCRPKEVIPVSYAKRQVCLCRKHQNMALRVASLRSVGLKQNLVDIKNCSKEYLEEKIESMPGESIKFQTWKQITEADVKRTTLVDESETKEQFKENMWRDLVDFKEHDWRVITQYANFSLLKSNLPDNTCTVQIDFSENYTCNFQNEIAAAYYSKVQVTLHPAVFHFKGEDGELCHKSVVIVSDEISHRADSIYAFLKSLIKWLRSELPHIQLVHYLSDSPTSQYRNSTIFGILGKHEELFGIKGTWHYFESGHGKGPCDGVGGALKRAADIETKKGGSITSARSFFQWAKGRQSNITVVYVDSAEVTEASKELNYIPKIPVPGTLKVHAVVPKGKDLYTRATSCFAIDCCWSGEAKFQPKCEGWENSNTVKKGQQKKRGRRTTKRADKESVEVHGKDPVVLRAGKRQRRVPTRFQEN